MNLNQLHYFVTLAYMEHYTKAAKQLSITQPSLSHAIGMLSKSWEPICLKNRGVMLLLQNMERCF